MNDSLVQMLTRIRTEYAPVRVDNRCCALRNTFCIQTRRNCCRPVRLWCRSEHTHYSFYVTTGG